LKYIFFSRTTTRSCQMSWV